MLNKREYLFGVPMELVGSVKQGPKSFEKLGRTVKIKVSDLHVDRKTADNPNGYQRKADLERAIDIANNFNSRSERKPLVSRRKGTKKYYVIGGQHTIMAHILLGHMIVEVQLLDDMTTQEEESIMFSDCNNNIKGIHHNLKFANQFSQNNSLIVDINNILVSKGFSCVWDVTNVRKDAFICESTLIELFNHDNGISLEKTLLVMNQAWDDSKLDRRELLKSFFIVGLFKFIVKYDAYLDTSEKLAKFIKKCKRMSPKEINKDSTTGTTNKYEVTFKSLYNYGLPKISDNRID